jgi:TolA-binding protein
MADPKEQTAPGRAPIDPVLGTRGRPGPGLGDARTLNVEMGQGPPPIRRPPGRSGIASGAVVLISAVVALVFGGAGAWAYERFLAPPSPAASAATSTPLGDTAEMSKNLASMDDRINGLSDQCKQLQAHLEAMPKPAPVSDLAPIEQKVARVDQLSQQVEALGKKLDPLPERLVQDEHKVTELDAKLDELRKEVSAAHDRGPAGPTPESSTTGADRPSTAEEAESVSPSPEKGGASVGPAFESAVSQFRKKQYRAAYAVFRRLLLSHPDDARTWYYAALSYGLASNDWGKMTEVMVEQGLAHERAGQPRKSEIDSAFAGLTKETGKDWLDGYRQRAR